MVMDLNTLHRKPPLRYRISDFRQLNHCMSNNSRDLSIVVTTFVNDSRLNGLRIRVEHKTFGTLFACVVSGSGSLMSYQEDSGIIYELTPGIILQELKKYGFLIEYDPVDKLSGNQLDYLVTLNQLHFDKIRILNVWSAPLGVKEYHTHIVVFIADRHGDWLNAGYSPSLDEFTSALQSGSAMDISTISQTQNYNWSWLYGWVGDINDILEDNTGIRD